MLASTPGENAFVRSVRLKRQNAVTAALFAGLPAIVLSRIFPGSLERYFIGFLAGTLWANAFEYFYHRSLLHGSAGILARHHMQHHAATGTSDEAEHVNFGESPVWVALLFVVNGVVAVAADVLLGLRMGPGILTAFGIYFVVLEEIHWRIHLEGWLPPGLRAARVYHLEHHDRADARFNVFLPLFDLLFGTAGSRGAAPVCRPLG